MKAVPNAEMLSHQIESLRIVLRRMKNSPSNSLDALINKKLKEVK